MTERRFNIYLVTHRETGKQYVGATNGDVELRWSKHDIGFSHMGAAVRAYGFDAFTVEHIACAVGKKDAHIVEGQAVIQYQTVFPFGYNLTFGGAKKITNRERGYRCLNHWPNHMNPIYLMIEMTPPPWRVAA